jgi:hypothetical protein
MIFIAHFPPRGLIGCVDPGFGSFNASTLSTEGNGLTKRFGASRHWLVLGNGC